MRKKIPFDDVVMKLQYYFVNPGDSGKESNHDMLDDQIPVFKYLELQTVNVIHLSYNETVFIETIPERLSKILRDYLLNSSPPSAGYMRQWIGSALVQLMACHLFGTKPLSKLMLGYCQLDP